MKGPLSVSTTTKQSTTILACSFPFRRHNPTGASRDITNKMLRIPNLLEFTFKLRTQVVEFPFVVKFHLRDFQLELRAHYLHPFIGLRFDEPDDTVRRRGLRVR